MAANSDPKANIVDSLEAILFVADSPVALEVLARELGVTQGQVSQALEILAERLHANGSIQLVELAGGFQLSTKPEFAELIGSFLSPQRQKLSRSLMEVLAIVAYKQPVTMGDVEKVRGVQSDYSIRALLERRLIREVGRKIAPGRPVLYGTTQQFLHQFNLKALDQLPPLDSVTEEAANIIRHEGPSLFD
ncbi:MAG: SMC-Scp complex subunit ScpB [Fimbriimonadaceae bacterium]|nr:SMC-Scp complex subunit ScpB [Fimbriimonadaceae bacterium]